MEEFKEVAAKICKILVECGTYKTNEANNNCFAANMAETVGIQQVNETLKSRVKGDTSKLDGNLAPSWKSKAPNKDASQKIHNRRK